MTKKTIDSVDYGFKAISAFGWLTFYCILGGIHGVFTGDMIPLAAAVASTVICAWSVLNNNHLPRV